jgi:DNA repair protein RecO (recombination protein O)
MIRQTEAIVLRARPFSDTSLVLTLYSQAFGRIGLMAKGVRTTKGRQRHALFQPTSVLQVVYYHKPGRELQLLSESNLAVPFQQLQVDALRIFYALATVEVFESCVREEAEANDALYNLLRTTLVDFDALEAGLYSQFVGYLLDLCTQLGFAPQLEGDPTTETLLFDIEEGRLVHTHATPDAPAQWLGQYLLPHTCWASVPPPPSSVRKDLIGLLMRFLEHHVAGFRPPNTLAVMEVVFA